MKKNCLKYLKKLSCQNNYYSNIEILFLSFIRLGFKI